MFMCREHQFQSSSSGCVASFAEQLEFLMEISYETFPSGSIIRKGWIRIIIITQMELAPRSHSHMLCMDLKLLNSPCIAHSIALEG